MLHSTLRPKKTRTNPFSVVIIVSPVHLWWIWRDFWAKTRGFRVGYKRMKYTKPVWIWKNLNLRSKWCNLHQRHSFFHRNGWYFQSHGHNKWSEHHRFHSLSLHQGINLCLDIRTHKDIGKQCSTNACQSGMAIHWCFSFDPYRCIVFVCVSAAARCNQTIRQTRCRTNVI